MSTHVSCSSWRQRVASGFTSGGRSCSGGCACSWDSLTARTRSGVSVVAAASPYLTIAVGPLQLRAIAGAPVAAKQALDMPDSIHPAAAAQQAAQMHPHQQCPQSLSAWQLDTDGGAMMGVRRSASAASCGSVEMYNVGE